MFKMSNYVHNGLKISNERDIELNGITTYIANKVYNESEFLLILEKRNDLSLIEKLYVAAQFGRLYRGEINKGEIKENNIINVDRIWSKNDDTL